MRMLKWMNANETDGKERHRKEDRINEKTETDE